MRRLPPLHTLVAFEAAARLGSFLRAAEELCITPSAVSHRIRTLEDWLDRRLFVRRTRSIALSADGARYLAEIQHGLTVIEAAGQQLRHHRSARLHVSVAPALGAKWLAAQLPAFRTEHPDIDLTLSTSTSIAPLIGGEADVGVRYGRPPWPGLVSRKLRDEQLLVVCSPGYRVAARRLNAPADLVGATLLRHPLLDWRAWFGAAGLAEPPPDDGPLFDDAMMMLEAAVSGAGVALMVALLAAPYLAAGTLVEPFALRVPDKAFYAIATRDNLERPEVRLFVRWLQARVR